MYPDLSYLTAADIERLTYPEVVALMRETNRCPGGKRSINRIAQLTHLDNDSRVLEIGCSTGFTSIELATISRAQIVGIDVVESAVAEAERRRLSMPESIRDRLQFQALDLFNLDQKFAPVDLLIVGGATSFMRRKQEAAQLYKKLVRPYGMLSVTTLFYHSTPPASLVDEVGEVIGTQIDVHGKEAWLALFMNAGFELYHAEEHELEARPVSVIDTYVNTMMAQAHLQTLSQDAHRSLSRRWHRTMSLFNENHRYLNFLLVLLRCNPEPEQMELFLPKGTITGFL